MNSNSSMAVFNDSILENTREEDLHNKDTDIVTIKTRELLNQRSVKFVSEDSLMEPM